MGAVMSTETAVSPLIAEHIATAVMEAVCNNSSGGSVNRLGFAPLEGYMVGGKSWTLTCVPEMLDYYTVLDFVTAHAVALSWNTVYIGWWTHEGRIYLDVCDNVQDYSSALELGRMRKEIAIYDLNEGVEVKCQ